MFQKEENSNQVAVSIEDSRPAVPHDFVNQFSATLDNGSLQVHLLPHQGKLTMTLQRGLRCLQLMCFFRCMCHTQETMKKLFNILIGRRL